MKCRPRWWIIPVDVGKNLPIQVAVWIARVYVCPKSTCAWVRNADAPSIAKLPDSVQGSISSYEVRTSSGRKITYHKLQYWAGGKNHSVHIPSERLAEFKAAVESGGRLRELLAELNEVTVRDILSSAPALKSSRSPSGAHRARRR